MAEIYALDSNIYIKALRDPRQLAVLKRFLIRTGTRLRVNAVVAMELRAGARTDAQIDAVEALIRPYAERKRVVAASFEGYMLAGRVLSALFAERGSTASYGSRSFTNDALIAASCREQDITLITQNTGDFAAIKRHLRGFRFLDAAEGLRAQV